MLGADTMRSVECGRIFGRQIAAANGKEICVILAIERLCLVKEEDGPIGGRSAVGIRKSNPGISGDPDGCLPRLSHVILTTHDKAQFNAIEFSLGIAQGVDECRGAVVRVVVDDNDFRRARFCETAQARRDPLGLVANDHADADGNLFGADGES